MKCPKCKKTLRPQATACKYCGTKIIRKSDKMVRRMTMNARIATACGGLLLLIGGIIAFYGAYLMGAIAAGVGVVLIFVGKGMA